MNLKLKRILYILATLFWMSFIFYFSSIPNLKSQYEADFLYRKVAHILEYFILTFLLFKTFKSLNFYDKKSIFAAIFFSIIYAATDEYHQTFIFGRDGKFYDILIDSFGSFLFYLFYFIKNKKSEFTDFKN